MPPLGNQSPSECKQKFSVSFWCFWCHNIHYVDDNEVIKGPARPRKLQNPSFCLRIWSKRREPVNENDARLWFGLIPQHWLRLILDATENVSHFLGPCRESMKWGNSVVVWQREDIVVVTSCVAVKLVLYFRFSLLHKHSDTSWFFLVSAQKSWGFLWH